MPPVPSALTSPAYMPNILPPGYYPYYPPPAPTYSPAPSYPPHRVIRLRRSDQAATLPDNCPRKGTHQALQCHALDRDFPIDHPCLGLLIKSDHATASGIGEGAHAATASFAGNCQCHAGVRKAALPDGRRCGAARRQAKLAKRRAELSLRPPRSPVRVFKVPRTRSEHVPSRSRTLPKAAGILTVKAGFGPSSTVVST
jgi:hypothetical protein